MSRVFQTVFYLLGYTREEVCEKDTNKLEWKKAKLLINEDFFKRLGEYNPFGAKDGHFHPYQKLRFLKRNISMYEPEQVDDYSIALGKLFRWLQTAIELREEDVVLRREHIAKLKDERQVAKDAAEERDKLRDHDLNTAIAEFDAKEDERLALLEEEEDDGSVDRTQLLQRRVFDEAAHLKKWDEENAQIDIPPEVVDYIDNDFDLEYDENQKE